MQLFPTYEGNRPSGLGGDSEQTDKQTDRGATSINNIDELFDELFNSVRTYMKRGVITIVIFILNITYFLIRTWTGPVQNGCWSCGPVLAHSRPIAVCLRCTSYITTYTFYLSILGFFTLQLP